MTPIPATRVYLLLLVEVETETYIIVVVDAFGVVAPSLSKRSKLITTLSSYLLVEAGRVYHDTGGKS
jgi:hypothetical protein